jgi:hypothetical protein
MKIENRTVVLNLKETDRERKGPFGGQYPHVVEDKIYYQMNKPQQIHYAVQGGEGYHKPANNVIISKSLAAHNFKVFIDENPSTPKNERYKAVGGYHVGRGSKSNPNLHAELKGCKISKGLPVVEYPNPVWPDRTKLLFKDDFYHPRHANGMYVFVSSDGVSWSEYHEKPIFSILTPCLDEEGNKMPDGIIGLDYMPSIFYDEKIGKYVAYLRANLSLGCRSVLYSESSDLKEWTTPQLISCTPEFDKTSKQNFYYPAVYPYKDGYIAFPPHFVNKIMDKAGHRRIYEEECTFVMTSEDRLNWKKRAVILECTTGRHLYQPHVVTFRREGEDYYIYTHEGFQTPNGKVVKYKIDMDDLS